MCDLVMNVFVLLRRPISGLPKKSILGIFAVVLTVAPRLVQAEDSPDIATPKPKISDSQKAVNAFLGAPLINTPDSSIAYGNANFAKETPYNRQQNEKARQRVGSLSSTRTVEDAERIIREVLQLDVSSSVKTDFRKASLLQMATHGEQKRSLEEAQKYLSEYLQRYSDDALIPVVLLRQGDLYRKMGAYDLERQKCYDVIKAAPKVKLDDKFNLNYVKRVAFIARSQIADSFYAEAEKLPFYAAKVKYANAADMYKRLLRDAEANKRVVSIKYIRSRFKQGEYPEVRRAGESYLELFSGVPEAHDGEVRYLLLDAVRRTVGGDQDYLSGYRDWFGASPAVGHDGEELKWRLKAASDLASELFDSGQHADSMEFFQALANLMSGKVKEPERYLLAMLAIKRISREAAVLEAADVSEFEITNKIKPLLVDLQAQAATAKIGIPLLDSIIQDENIGEGQEDGGFPAWSVVKPALRKTLANLVRECDAIYTAILPVIFRIALCSGKTNPDSALRHYERIRVGAIDLKPSSTIPTINEVYHNQEIKFHVLKVGTGPDKARGLLVCVWNGSPADGDEVQSEEGSDQVIISDYVGLADLADGTNLHDKSLPLKLIADMAAWRISTLKWREMFSRQVKNVER